MDLKITKTLVIPSNEIKWRFSRSSGPGGQNVNKIKKEKLSLKKKSEISEEIVDRIVTQIN